MPAISRRGILGIMLAAPAIIRTPGLIMPVKPVRDARLTGAYLAHMVRAYAAAAGSGEQLAGFLVPQDYVAAIIEVCGRPRSTMTSAMLG